MDEFVLQLEEAVRIGNLKEVKRLVENGVNVNIISGGWTPLSLAACRRHLPVAEYLVKVGANVNAADKIGWTALHYAAWDGNTSIVKLLLEAGANYNSCNKEGKTPKIIAQSEGLKHIVVLLQAYEDAVDVKEPGCD